jgi:hypothetical protein
MSRYQLWKRLGTGEWHRRVRREGHVANIGNEKLFQNTYLLVILKQGNRLGGIGMIILWYILKKYFNPLLKLSDRCFPKLPIRRLVCVCMWVLHFPHYRLSAYSRACKCMPQVKQAVRRSGMKSSKQLVYDLGKDTETLNLEGRRIYIVNSVLGRGLD